MRRTTIDDSTSRCRTHRRAGSASRLGSRVALALAIAGLVDCHSQECPAPKTPAAVPGQRCAADDPACGPEPFSATCLEQTDYERDTKRIPLAPQPSQAGDECSHDGECADSGCGYHCGSLRSREDQVFTCEHRPDVEKRLEAAYCGCIHGYCQWFEQ